MNAEEQRIHDKAMDLVCKQGAEIDRLRAELATLKSGDARVERSPLPREHAELVAGLRDMAGWAALSPVTHAQLDRAADLIESLTARLAQAFGEITRLSGVPSEVARLCPHSLEGCGCGPDYCQATAVEQPAGGGEQPDPVGLGWAIRASEDDLAVIDLIEEVRALRSGVGVSYASPDSDPVRRLFLLSLPAARENTLRAIEGMRRVQAASPSPVSRQGEST